MGNMTRDKLPFAGPAWGELYPEPPHFYRNTGNLILRYEVDVDAANRFLPEHVSLRDDHPHVLFWFQDTPFCTFGAHKGAYLFMEAEFKGEEFLYEAFLWVSSEAAMTAGRELWGDSKKMAEITLESEREEMVGTLSRGSGVPVARARMRLQRWGDDSNMPNVPGLCLKMIPKSSEPKSFEVLQLVTDDLVLTPVVGSDGRAEIFTGAADIHFTPDRNLEPVATLAPIGAVEATFVRAHMDLGFGRILHDYNDEA